jgi:uncharacterized RDD family membrane protein YckC
MAAAYLATPLRRIAAAAIDLAVLMLVAPFVTAVVQEIRLDILTIGVAAFVIFVVYHGSFLYYWTGMTPGRRVLSIRVVSARAAVGLMLVQCAARPLLRLIWLFAFIPLEGTFGIPWVSLVPVFADLVLMTVLPSRQTVADLVCRTVVVNDPPPQPHRAPAGPMYSATDAEFGVPARPGR